MKNCKLSPLIGLIFVEFYGDFEFYKIPTETKILVDHYYSLRDDE